MAPSIGNQYFQTMTTTGIPYAMDIDAEITRPGVYGVAFLGTGFKGEPVTVQTKSLCTSKEALETVAYTYATMKGGIYTVVDGFGNTRYNIRVNNVRVVNKQQVITSSVTDHVATLTVQWELQDISTGYI